MVLVDAHDFEVLHRCLQQQTFEVPLMKEFVYDWLPKKVKYLSTQEAVKMNTKLNNDDFQDIAQRLFEILYEKIESIEPGVQLRSWICKAIIHTTRNYIRKKRKNTSVDTTESNNIIETNLEKNRIKPIISEYQSQKLYDYIQQLPENLYYPFVLKYIEGRSSKDIADMLGITVSQVDQRNHRAKQKLGNKLIKFFPQYTN